MPQRHSLYRRVTDDFYVEPDWVVDALFSSAQPFLFGRVHDPCAGFGTIVGVAQKHEFAASGADIVDRADGRFPVCDFFSDAKIYSNIICNPPYKRAADLVAKALALNLPRGGKVAVLVPLGFLASGKRFGLFNRPELDEILVLSRRPSLPPGELLMRAGESCRHSGSTDFCWAIWRRGRDHEAARVGWIPPYG
jgi:hypothetical protein